MTVIEIENRLIFAMVLVSLATLQACKSSRYIASRTFANKFDESQYINPQDFGYPLSIKEIEQHPPADTLFLPATVQGGMRAAFSKITYPVEAQTNDIQGKVVLRLYVNKTGKLAKIAVLESPHKLLTKATLEAATQWQYKAATLSGTPVNSFFHVPVNFHTQTQQIGIEG